MKASELTKAKYYLNTELEDDSTEYGGIAHRGETLKEFICDAYELDDTTGINELEMSEVNVMLIRCGIKPIDYRFEKERKDFIAMTALYYGEFKHRNDCISTLIKIVKFAETYDFDVCEEDGEWVIDTEKARDAAWEFAKNLSKESERENV